MQHWKGWQGLAVLVVAVLAAAIVPATVDAQTSSTVSLATHATLGDILVAENGLTLYVFTPDEPGVSNCNGGCAAAWPPLTVADGATPTLGAGVSGELTLITREDGSRQVALDGAPLYFYRDDGVPGDANGQNVNGVWFVLDATGAIVQVTPTVDIGGNTSLGEFLVAGNGLTLYVFTPDEPGVSNCNGGCAAAWPPLGVADGETPNAASGGSGELTLIVREDGSQQVALDGAPLYFYRDDAVPGDANGQNVNEVWFVLDPSGAIIPAAAVLAAQEPVPAPPASGSGGLSTDGGGVAPVVRALLARAAGALALGGRSLAGRRPA
jgi:predicted lipoprotein with Yx(FWY)xxD motif